MSKLLALALVLLISVGTLAGSTIAWFTDSVTSGNNIIKSGTLEVELFTSTDNQNWSEVKDGSGPIYNYQYWEPGYTDVRLFEIRNTGSLAFRYKLDIRPSELPQSGKADLAEVIDVYCLPVDASFQLPTKFSDITVKPVGTLAELSAAASDPDGAIHGVILPANVSLPAADQDIAATGSQTVCIALHMQESAGNEYQDLSIGEGFSLQLLATQYTYENDAFDNGYDAGAQYPANGPAVFNGTSYETLAKAIAAANKAGGGTITLNESHKVNEALTISANITINGNGNKVSRADDFTGTMFTVSSDSTLTLEDVKLDGGAVWTGEIDPTLGRGTVNSGVTVTGNLIATGSNSHIVLNEGAILENNDGAHAVNLGTRIGATLILNGGQIINNNSGSGAIWGGGHITVNSGSISSNSSTSSAGAIRMVSNCNLTMNGGEISKNKAAESGGAIWGYGASTYTFSGGKMNDNYAAVGGAMYTGDGSTVNISGSFELCNNTADDAGALRLSNRTAFNMTGGKVSGNESKNNPDWDGFYGWNPGVNISGGALEDDITIQGGLTPTIGGNGITGVIHFALSTNHNTANLAKDFGTIKFTVAEGNNFSNFNFKPAADYTYTASDEAKLICMNDGYATYWDAATGTFRLKAK